MFSRRIGERGRVIGITLGLTILYLLLQKLWLGFADLPFASSIAERPTDAQLELEAKKVAEASKSAIQSAPPLARVALVKLGFQLGFVSQLVGSYALSEAAVQAKIRQLVEPRLLTANRISESLGLGTVGPLTSRTVDDFVRLTDRIEADEFGVSARITEKYSVYHLHLFMLGAHLGTEAARIESSGGTQSLPPRAQIRRHAMLAGVPKTLWEPLAAQPGPKEKPDEVVARYATGLPELEANLSTSASVN